MPDEYEAEKARREAELAELDRQLLIRDTALAMGVLPQFLQNARGAEQIEQHARDTLAWKAGEPQRRNPVHRPAPPNTTASVNSDARH